MTSATRMRIMLASQRISRRCSPAGAIRSRMRRTRPLCCSMLCPMSIGRGFTFCEAASSCSARSRGSRHACGFLSDEASAAPPRRSGARSSCRTCTRSPATLHVTPPRSPRSSSPCRVEKPSSGCSISTARGLHGSTRPTRAGWRGSWKSSARAPALWSGRNDARAVHAPSGLVLPQNVDRAVRERHSVRGQAGRRSGSRAGIQGALADRQLFRLSPPVLLGEQIIELTISTHVRCDEGAQRNDPLASLAHEEQRASDQLRADAAAAQLDRYLGVGHRNDSAIAAIVDERERAVHVELVAPAGRIVSDGVGHLRLLHGGFVAAGRYIAWAKLDSVAEGARLATRELAGRGGYLA